MPRTLNLHLCWQFWHSVHPLCKKSRVHNLHCPTRPWTNTNIQNSDYGELRGMFVWRWLDSVDLSKRKTWRRERQRLLFQRNRRKPWCVWFTSKIQLVNHLYTFLVAKDLRIDWKSFKISANGDLWNLPTHQFEWKIHSTKCLRNWNQNMANIETVIGALPKLLLPEIFHRGFRNNSVI